MSCQEILRRNVKGILLFIDSLFLFLGVLILTISSVVKAYYHEYEQLLNPAYFYASDFMMVVGIAMILISSIGCFGRINDSASVLSCFSGLLLVLLILEVLIAVAGIIMKSQAEGIIADTLNKTILEYGQPVFNETTAIWDKVQNTFHCCGVLNDNDWSRNNVTHGGLPVSCCRIPAGTTNNITCDVNSPNLYRQGCLTELVNYVISNAGAVEGLGIGVAVFQVLVMVGTFYLAKHARSDYETV